MSLALPVWGVLTILLATCECQPDRSLEAAQPNKTDFATSKIPTLFEATDSRLKDLENAASRCATAADALLVYNNFQHTHRISAALKNRYEE